MPNGFKGLNQSISLPFSFILEKYLNKYYNLIFMIFQIWLTFFCSSLGLLTIGYYMKNDLLRILGVLLLFFCGLGLDPIGGGVDINTGATANYSLITNETATATQIDTYTNYSSHLYGFYTMIASLLTFVFIMFERRTPNGKGG